MALKHQTRQDAEEFVDVIKRLFAAQSGLIYGVEDSVDDPNVISIDTIGATDAWVEVTLYNISDPNHVFDAHTWIRIGEMGADVDTHTGSSWNGYTPTVEIHKRFD